MEIKTVSRLSALAHPQRLALFRLLMRRFPDRVPAGELAQALDLKSSTLSAYLATLVHSGLLTQERAGTSLLYAINMTGVQQTFEHLFLDCCRGRPELCPPLAFPSNSGTKPMPDTKYSVLFICTGNSARSILAESVLRHEAGDLFEAYSAGTKPYSELNPFAVEVLKSKGHDTSPLRAKNVSEFQTPDAPQFDFVFTVCDRAANEDCPAWPGQPISAHWGMPDPVKVKGTEAEKSLAFQQAYGELRRRISAFAALPITSLDRVSLQRAVDGIANAESEVLA
ncbi:helix-turn-helix domain-containing protein [Sedimentitalea sp.]|uniref:arsenate reductase/protein-tyrosine-phosphatase family protein n=1 Tax=Sedimentitalea sp. TaxID=2048915 RepID=UPI0032998431